MKVFPPVRRISVDPSSLRILLRAAPFVALVLCLTTAANAIITIRDPGRNLCPPTGDLKDSGWQYEGDWHSFTGTVIGPHHFITAAHVGGYPGEAFIYRDHTYRALDATIVPGTDICIWSVLGKMPAWAPLYEGHSEVAHDLTLFGRGAARGKPIVSFGVRRGWYWDQTDGRLSWGRSWVSAVTERSSAFDFALAAGDTFLAPFDSDIGPDAGIASGGDSGGGVFLKDDDGKWKLAGVIYGVDKTFLPTATASSSLPVALYDGRGLYHTLTGGMRGMVATYSVNSLPSQTIVSRLSSNIPAIRAAVNSKAQIWRVALTLCLILVLPPVLVIALIVYTLRRRSPMPVNRPDASSAYE